MKSHWNRSQLATRLKKLGFRAEARILVLLGSLGLGLLLFLHLASEVLDGETMAFDRKILISLRRSSDLAIPIGPHWLTKAMSEITILGGGTILTLMTAAVAIYLFVANRRATAVFVVAAVSGGAILSAILKHAFERSRPEVVPHLVTATSASFPSGHAMNSAITYLTLGTLLAKSERRTAVRIYLISVAVVLTIIVGCSRVYLGVHWPTDVVAGWCVGAIWALACSMVAQYLQNRRTLERNSAPSNPRDASFT